MEISIMDKSDIPAVLEIENASFSVPWTEGMFISELDNTRCLYITAKENGKLLGFAGMSSILDEGYVNNIAVAPSYRRRGIGRRLMSALIEYSYRLSLSFLTLEVRESNTEAISLYSGLGFVLSGKRNGYYERPKENALLMTLSIKPEPSGSFNTED